MICPGESGPLSHLPRDYVGDVAAPGVGDDGDGIPGRGVRVTAQASETRMKSATRPVKITQLHVRLHL